MLADIVLNCLIYCIKLYSLSSNSYKNLFVMLNQIAYTFLLFITIFVVSKTNDTYSILK